MKNLNAQQQAELNAITYAVISGILVKSHAKGEHKSDSRGHCPLCKSNTFKVKVLSSASYIEQGEIYEIIKVKYFPASHMIHESWLYALRISDGRVGWYKPELFDIIQD